jgi:hypothetical protein
MYSADCRHTNWRFDEASMAIDETTFRSGSGSSSRPVRPALPVRMPRNARRRSLQKR